MEDLVDWVMHIMTDYHSKVVMHVPIKRKSLSPFDRPFFSIRPVSSSVLQI